VKQKTNKLVSLYNFLGLNWKLFGPKGYVCAVLLTFDFDAESDELRTDQKKDRGR